ncbi:hypothetical protein DEO72_LG5g3243 [Vigna unguiculata]|uniref:Uncharacterized protein n=1 Tax=Vigna unguiculata TaxID=3917 RepID=A0A4D6M314_VIGUN|nr:hypothetical protein DEO72_LG5g3243 [Vigna unguiculata]
MSTIDISSSRDSFGREGKGYADDASSSSLLLRSSLWNQGSTKQSVPTINNNTTPVHIVNKGLVKNVDKSKGKEAAIEEHIGNTSGRSAFIRRSKEIN